MVLPSQPVRDPVTGRRTSASAGTIADGYSGRAGNVSGRTSAVRGGSDGVALVDVRAGTAELMGSRSGVYTAFAWSPAGHWLFFATGDGGLMASHHGTGRAITLPAKVPGAVLGMVAR